MISDVDGWRVHSFRRFSSFLLGLHRGWIVIKLCKLGRLESYFLGFILGWINVQQTGWINIQQTALFTKSSVQYFPTKDLFPLYRGSIIESYACVCGVIPKVWFRWFIICTSSYSPIGSRESRCEDGRPGGWGGTRSTAGDRLGSRNFAGCSCKLRWCCGPGRRKS